MAEQLAWLSCNEIVPNRYQPRRDFKAKELEELAESIDQQGLLQPIIVRTMDDLEEGKKYELIAGERRWRATKDILGKDKIRAIIRSMSEESSQEAAITENLQRQDLNPIEEALAFQKLIDLNSLTQEQAAKRLGKSRSYLSNILRLLRLDPEIQQMVAAKMLEPSKAWSLLAILDEKKQLVLAKRTIAKNWTLDRLRVEVEKIVNTEKSDDKPKVIRKTIDGTTKTVATPSRGHRRKESNKISSRHFVLVELDNANTVRDFVKYMNEQEWKCWTGEAAISQLEEIKKLAHEEEQDEETEEALEAFENEQEEIEEVE